MRRSSLDTIDVGIDRELSSQFDAVKLVAGSIDDVERVSAAIEDGSVEAANSIAGSIQAIGANIIEVTAVGANIDDVIAVAGDLSNVDIVATNIANVNAVGPIATDVSTVANEIAAVAAVADVDNMADIKRVADDLNAIDANMRADITIVAEDLSLGVDSNVVVVSQNIDDVIIVANDIADVTAVGSNIDSVITVAGSIDAIETTAANIVDIQNAEENAASALSSTNIASAKAGEASVSAATASTQAGIATTKASEANASAASALVSQNAASVSAGNSLTSANNADVSDANALASADSAASSASVATTKASEANASAVSASGSAADALASKNSASTSATTATTKAAEAVISASSAAVSAGVATTKANEASLNATSALASETKAEKWATEDEDVEVETGEYSAKHWALKAQWFAEGNAENIGYDNTDRGLVATNVQDAIDEIDGDLDSLVSNVYTKTEVTTALALKVSNSEKGTANGVATLDTNGKVVLPQLPDSILGQLEYIGTWNFTTMPTATQKGQYWIASVSGNGYEVGDWAVWNGTSFDKIDNTDAVSSVAGRTGNIVLAKDDVGLSNVDNIADANKNVLSATKLTTTRNITLTGDITGNVNFDGTSNVTIATTVAPNSVALGTDTTGNYVAGNTAGPGISITGTAGEGWSPTIAIDNTVTTLTGTQTLTNKTLQDSTTFIVDNVDSSKKVQFEVSGVATATTRIMSIPNTNGTLITSGDSGTITSTMIADGTIVNADINASAGIVDTKLATISTAGKVLNSATSATNLNTANSIVSRDASGNFTAGTVTASLAGNASTATTLQTGRTIGMTGDVSWTSASFNGSGNVTGTSTLATVTDSGIGTFKKITTDTKGRVTGTQAVTQSDITGLLGTGSISNNMLANTAVSNLSGTNTGDQTITLSGDVTGSGTGTFSTVLSNTGVVAGTYKSLTVDAKGRVSAGSNPTTVAGYGLTDVFTKTEVQTVLPKVGFDTSNATAPTTGQLAWNSEEATLDLGINGATLQIGQEQLIRVRNNSGSSITNGRAVMATGTLGNSGRIVVGPANLTQANAKYVLGVVTESIANGADGFCTTFGKVRGINTTGSDVGETWLDGDVLYVKDSGNGVLTKVIPTDSQVKLPVAIVIHAQSSGTLFVRVNSIDENHAKVELSLKAAIASPTFTGVPKAPTASVGTSTPQIATTAFVRAEIDKIEEW